MMNHELKDESPWPMRWRVARRGFRHFLPAIALMWIVVEIAAAQVPRAPWLAQTGLFILFLDFYLAAAARSLGVSKQPAFWLATERAGIAIEPLLVVSGVAGLGFVAALIVLFQDSLLISAAAILLTTAVIVFVFLRSWPMWGIPFFFAGQVLWSPAAEGSRWSGPGLRAAWALTGARGVWNPHSRRVVLAVLSVSLLVLCLKVILDQPLLADLLLYVLGLPLVSLLVVFGTGRLLQESQIDLGDS